jgi:hypothetical protein
VPKFGVASRVVAQETLDQSLVSLLLAGDLLAVDLEHHVNTVPGLGGDVGR